MRGVLELLTWSDSVRGCKLEELKTPPTTVTLPEVTSLKAGPLNIQQVSSVQAEASLLPPAELSGAGQNPSRPSVTAGQPHPPRCLANVHVKTTLMP